MFDFAISGVQVPAFLLIFVGFTVGIVGGFIGVGGGYMVTPALIVFGFPGYMASGIDMTHIAGKALVSAMRHRQLGHVDWRLALTTVGGSIIGVELGIRTLEYFKEAGLSTPAVLAASLVVMLGVFVYTQFEVRRAHKEMQRNLRDGLRLSRDHRSSTASAFFQRLRLAPRLYYLTAGIRISVWVVVLVGMITGFLAGFLGVGGGFLRVPALVHLVGVSTHVAVGTDLLEIVISGGFGAWRHSLQGNVDFVAVLFLISGAVVGAQIGSIATSFVRGPTIRYILSYSLILACAGAAVRLVSVFAGDQYPFLIPVAAVLTLGEMFFLSMFILTLVWFAMRAKKGRWIPVWAMTLVLCDEPPSFVEREREQVGAAVVQSGATNPGASERLSPPEESSSRRVA